MAAWFKESVGGAGDRDGTLLAYAVTTSAWELARQAARATRIEAAERAIAMRASRRPSRRKTPAADDNDHAGKLAADKAASRSRSRRRRARAQHDAKAPDPGNAELLPADDTAVPSPAGPA